MVICSSTLGTAPLWRAVAVHGNIANHFRAAATIKGRVPNGGAGGIDLATQADRRRGLVQRVERTVALFRNS